MIVYCASDLIFSTKIHSTAQSLGLESRPARSAEALQARLDRVADGKCNSAVSAVLIDLDLGEAAIELIRRAVSHPQRPHVTAFGAHVAVDLLQRAQEAGADRVMPRGHFTAELPRLLSGLAGG